MPLPIVEFSYPRSGPTAERPVDPPIGTFYFDTTIGYQLAWNETVDEQWETCNVKYGTTAQRPSASAVPPGALYFNTGAGLLQFSDGSSVWADIAVEDNLSSSSTSSSNSSSSSTSSSSTSSSSTSSSSTSSSNSSSS